MVSVDSFHDANSKARLIDTNDPDVSMLRQFRTIIIVGACYVATAIALFSDSYGTLFVMNSTRFVPFAAATALLTICVRWLLSRPQESLYVWSKAYSSDFGPQVLGLNIAFVLGISAFSTYKTNISGILPFYADPYLSQIDFWLHGVQPWTYLHAMPQWMGGVIDYVYSRVWFLVMIGSFTLTTLVYQGGQLKRLIWAMFLNFALLGSIIAISLASVGPIFYDEFYPGGQFAGLTHALQANGEIFFVKQNAAYLLAAEKAGQAGLGTGISAMPSLHVAFAVTIAWLLTGWGRTWAVVGWSYAIFIMMGSVYTGWHYAVDGYVAATFATAAWLVLTRHYGLPLVRRRAGASAP